MKCVKFVRDNKFEETTIETMLETTIETMLVKEQQKSKIVQTDNSNIPADTSSLN